MAGGKGPLVLSSWRVCVPIRECRGRIMVGGGRGGEGVRWGENGRRDIGEAMLRLCKGVWWGRCDTVWRDYGVIWLNVNVKAGYCCLDASSEIVTLCVWNCERVGVRLGLGNRLQKVCLQYFSQHMKKNQNSYKYNISFITGMKSFPLSLFISVGKVPKTITLKDMQENNLWRGFHWRGDKIFVRLCQRVSWQLYFIAHCGVGKHFLTFLCRSSFNLLNKTISKQKAVVLTEQLFVNQYSYIFRERNFEVCHILVELQLSTDGLSQENVLYLSVNWIPARSK